MRGKRSRRKRRRRTYLAYQHAVHPRTSIATHLYTHAHWASSVLEEEEDREKKHKGERKVEEVGVV